MDAHMPIGLVSDDELAKELESYGTIKPRNVVPSTDPIKPVEIIDKTPRGRSDGDVNVPDSLRQIIGEESIINGRESALALARDFGISASSVSAYAHGATSTTTYDQPKSSIISHINKSRLRASKKAGKVLSAALEAISQDKLDYTDAKDLASIAKDMSVIIKNMEPPVQSDQASDVNSRGPQFVIFAPQFRDERSFETIEVKE